MLLINRRAWPRELFDEPIGWEPIGEEFSSEPVFNQQLHQVGDAFVKDGWSDFPAPSNT